MSNKELAIHLLDNVPPYKLGYVISYLQGITADEVADDEYCENLMRCYDSDKSTEAHETIELDDFANELGFSPEALRKQA